MTIRVASVEDDRRYRSSLESLFRLSPGLEPAGSYASPAAALAALEQAGVDVGWDVVVMDVDLPGMSGIEGTRRIKETLPDTPVIVLTVFEDPPTILEAICAGADGYLTKDTPPGELVEQIRSVVEGGSPLTSAVASTVLDLVRRFGVDGPDGSRGRAADGAERRTKPASSEAGDFGEFGTSGGSDVADESGELSLTRREKEVLACLVSGMQYKHVGRELEISIDTVRTHVRHIYRKLQVRNVAEAVTRALREDLL